MMIRCSRQRLQDSISSAATVQGGLTAKHRHHLKQAALTRYGSDAPTLRLFSLRYFTAASRFRSHGITFSRRSDLPRSTSGLTTTFHHSRGDSHSCAQQRHTHGISSWLQRQAAEA